MKLETYCRSLCLQPQVLPYEQHPEAIRMVCPEYSIYSQEQKTFPSLMPESFFALCWLFQPEQSLFCRLLPAEETDSACCCHFQNHSRTQLHTHEYLELAYVISGSFTQVISGNDITFQAGDVCLIDKNCLHQDYLLTQDACILFLGIANDVFEDLMSGGTANDKILNFLQSALLKQKNLRQYLHFRPVSEPPEAFETCLLSLLQELRCNDNASPLICRGLLLRLFRLLSSDFEFSLSREMRREMNWLIYEEISQFIQLHLADISIRKLCEQFHFQEDYFNRLLKQKCGMSYIEYVQDLRISKAAELLVTTDLGIDDIITRIGYQNKGYFYQLFCKKYQMTPAKYRKKKNG